MRIIAFITEATSINAILTHLRERTTLPEVASHVVSRSGTRRPSPCSTCPSV
jgi:hypothetical protein